MFEFTIDRERHRIFAVLSGELSANDLIDALEKINKHPEFDPSFAALVDGTGITRMPALHELREVAVAIRRMARSPGARRAIVTSSESFYALAQVFTVMTAGAVSLYRVFLNPERAEEWLVRGGAE